MATTACCRLTGIWSKETGRRLDVGAESCRICVPWSSYRKVAYPRGEISTSLTSGCSGDHAPEGADTKADNHDADCDQSCK